MSDNKNFILAAMLARSNMGQLPVKPRVISSLKSCKSMDLDNAVSGVCGDCMESDDHYDIFMKEARSFLRKIKKSVPAAWKDIEAAYEAA